MRDLSPETPEARRGQTAHVMPRPGWPGFAGLWSALVAVIRRVAVGVMSDGFIHAGNLAYLSLLTLFPFFIVMTAIAQLAGQSAASQSVITSILASLPPTISPIIAASVREVIAARTGPLLWFGAAVGLWTVGSFIETIRDILRRAYGTAFSRPFWHYRIISIAIIFLSVALMMIGLTAQLILVAVEEVIVRFFPAAQNYADWISGTRFVPVIAIYVALFMMFWTLAPGKYRGRGHPKWPGALFTTLWWFGAVSLLPRVLGLFGGYTLTYGGLAGVIVALLFFWLIGLGVVIGAHINAALANPALSGVRAPSTSDK